MNRSAGVLMHISSLYGDYSIGSFGAEAKEFVDFLSSMGFSWWQVLPFTMVDDCNSPYQSYSAFAGNPYFVDLPTLYEKGLITEKELEESRQNSPYGAEYERLKEERIALLYKASRRVKEAERQKIEDFIKERPNLSDFAEFMTLKKENGGKIWNEWENFNLDEDTFFMWKFIQYEFYTEWMDIKNYANEKGVRIIGDIPIYVSYDSSDVYKNKEEFLLDKDNIPKCVAGVPPDYFCEDGQLWGNPLYDWKAMKKNGYAWWMKRLSYMTELFDGVRIDHFRGLSSYYSIPYGEKTARNGKWVKGPGKAFINAVKEVCEGKLIIAEDLGDITEDVYELVKYSGFPGMRVLQFGFLGDDDNIHLPHNYEKNTVAYTGTHDNNTLLGYVWELSDENRRRLFDYVGYLEPDWDKGYDDVLRTMLQSHSDLVIFPIQDLLCYGADTRINTPGKADGNWTYRVTKEQLMGIDKEKFSKWLMLYKRR